MVRLGDCFYVTNVAGGNALYRIDQDGNWTQILSGFSSPLGLAVIGEDLLVAEYGANRIRRVTDLTDNPPTVSPFADSLPQASSFALDDEGNFILSHQKTLGRISKINANGGVTIYIGDTYDLSRPRGLVFSVGVIEVTIDIKPGSDPNSINLSSAGVIPVAILSSATFDATTVDPAKVSLAGAEIKMAGKSGKYLSHEEDVNDDGLLDLVCQVLITEDWAIEPGETMAGLTAETYDGQSIHGEDSIRIVPDK